MTRGASSDLLCLVLAASALGTAGCSSSSDTKGASPSKAGDRDASGVDSGPGKAGAGGASFAADGASGASAGGFTAPGDAGTPTPDGAPARDAGTSGATDAAASDSGLAPLVCHGAGSRFATGVISHTFG